MSRLIQKFHFLIEVVLKIIAKKRPGTSFEVTVIVEFFDKNFSFII